MWAHSQGSLSTHLAEGAGRNQSLSLAPQEMRVQRSDIDGAFTVCHTACRLSPHTITSILQVRTLRLREIKQVAQLSSFSQSWNMIKLRLELAVPS